MGSKGKRYLEYPFGKTWVYASAVMAGISIIFAIEVLSEEEPKSSTLMIPPLLLYFIFTSILTVAILALKFYLYSRMDEEPLKNSLIEDMEKTPKRRWRWSLIALLCLTIAALFSPLLLLQILEPLWWIIGISGFVPAVTIPEIILYTYSRRRLE